MAMPKTPLGVASIQPTNKEGGDAKHSQLEFNDSFSGSAVVRVNQHPLPGSEKARTMTVGSGTQCSMLLDLSSPLGAFSRILLASSHWTNSEEFCYVWNRLDTRFVLSAFQLTPLAQSTCDNGCSLLGTPDASNVPGPNGQKSSLKNTLGRMTLWRTPGADVQRGAMDGEKRLAAGHMLNLAEQAKTPKLWPTPTVPNGGRRNPEGTSITGKKPDGSKAQIDLREFAIREMEAGGLEVGQGSLNPEFVEWLQGFPVGWTELKCPALSPRKELKTGSRD